MLSTVFYTINIDVTVNAGSAPNRFFTGGSIGDTLVQVTDVTYTSASSPTEMLTTGVSFTGSVSGDLTGTIDGLYCTIWIDITSSTMRGVTAGHAEYADAKGTISLRLILDDEAQLSGGNIVGMTISGYIIGVDGTGDYVDKIILVKVSGILVAPDTYSLSGSGWIIDAGCCSLETFTITATRAASPGVDRTFTFEAGDMLVQFTGSYIALTGTEDAYFTTRQALTGTVSNFFSGDVTVDSNSILIDSGAYAGRGYSVATFKITSPQGDMEGFLLLDNFGYGSHQGYVVVHTGTGKYANLIGIGTFTGEFINPPDYYDYTGSADINICSIAVWEFPESHAGELIVAVSVSIIMVVTVLIKKSI